MAHARKYANLTTKLFPYANMHIKTFLRLQYFNSNFSSPDTLFAV